MNAIGPWELADLKNVIIDNKFLELCNYIFIIKLNTWTHLKYKEIFVYKNVYLKDLKFY